MKLKGGDAGDFNGFFYFVFFLILFIFGTIALYTTNAEIIGFVIFFVNQLLLTFTVIKQFRSEQAVDTFRYDADPARKKDNIQAPDEVTRFGFIRPLLNVRLMVAVELLLVSVSLLFMIITYSNINTFNSKNGINANTILSKPSAGPNAYTTNTRVNEKETYKIILIVLTILVFIVITLNGLYAPLKRIFTGYFNPLGGRVTYRPNSTFYYMFLLTYFIGSCIFLFFGYLPLDKVINKDKKIMDSKDQMAMKVLSVVNMFFFLLFLLVSYNFYKAHAPNSGYSKDIFGDSANIIYIVFGIGIYYLSSWAVYLSNTIRTSFLPSKMTDPPPPTGINRPSVQGCDPNKPESCPHPGSLPLQWLYSYGM